jgi:sulfur carrier protein
MSVAVTLNGAEHIVPEGACLRDAVTLLGVDPDQKGVAAAIDGTVVPRGAWAATPIAPGARIEVVRAAAGG